MQVEYVSAFQVVIGVIARFWPVWAALVIIMGASYVYKRKLGLYGQLFDSGVGIVGVGICLFWLFTAIFASVISPFNPLAQIPVMRMCCPAPSNRNPGSSTCSAATSWRATCSHAWSTAARSC